MPLHRQRRAKTDRPEDVENNKAMLENECPCMPSFIRRNKYYYCIANAFSQKTHSFRYHCLGRSVRHIGDPIAHLFVSSQRKSVNTAGSVL
jgi:hypothetical protein